MKSTREKILEDMLAIALMSQSELMQAIVLLYGRAKDRATLRDEPGYVYWRNAVSEAATAAEQRIELARKKREAA